MVKQTMETHGRQCASGAAKGQSNLKRLTSDEARKFGLKGGRASVAARRKKKVLRELLEIAMEQQIEGGEASTAEGIVAALIKRALAGDVKAFEVIRDTLGQNPRIKIDEEITTKMTVKHKISPAIAKIIAELQNK